MTSPNRFYDGRIETLNRQASRKPVVVNCAHIVNEGGFFEPQTENILKWMHFCPSDPVIVPRLGRKENLIRFAACLRAARAACRSKADLVCSHDPRISFVLQYCLRFCGYRGRHLALFFNYPWLPTGIKRTLHRYGFRRIDKFVVYSNVERELYHRYFDIPMDRIDFVHLGLAPPKVESPNKPLIEGDYICAIGSQSRDYRTFVESVRQLPEIKFVMVAKPENLAGLEIPSNVKVMTNLPYAQAMNILAFSRFMVLPLEGDQTPCGHITIVNAMHLGKAIAITHSVGVADYVREGDNALTFAAGNADEMSAVMHELWWRPDLCANLGRGGQAFAAEHCTEFHYFQSFMRILEELEIPLGGRASGVRDGPSSLS
jgi:glycosyltransferase involved in cell wall biosynthesis